MSEPTPTTLDQLVELFNEQLLASGIETQYTAEDLALSAPEAYDPGTEDPENPSDHNTRLPVTVGEGLEQVSYLLHYTRLDLEHLVSLRVAEIEGTGDEASTYDFLDALAAYLEVELTEDDVEDEILDTDGDDTYVVLKAKSTALGLIGEARLKVIVPAEPEG